MKPFKTVFYTVPALGSSRIRAEQLLLPLDADINQSLDSERLSFVRNIVFVKTLVDSEELTKLCSRTNVFFDPVDGDIGLKPVSEHPNITIFAISKTAKKYIEARTRNRTILLPQQHCNFERSVIPDRPVSVVGYVGEKSGLNLDLELFTEQLTDVGLSFKQLHVTAKTTREDVVEFYEGIDIQVSFRLPRVVQNMPPEMKSPLRIINAASFGIPTVGYPEISFEEFPLWLEAKTQEEVVAACHRLTVTFPISAKEHLVQRTTPYHVNNIIGKYQEILG